MPTEWGPPRFVKPLMWVIFTGLVAALAYVVWRVAPAVEEGWQYVDERRTQDAELIEAQRQAGEAYRENVKVEFEGTVKRGGPGDTGLVFRVSNLGKKDVLFISVRLAGPAAARLDEPYRLVLLDNTPFSVRDDRSLAPGERRTITLIARRDELPDLDELEWTVDRILVPTDQALTSDVPAAETEP